jgi:hypothetical protein
MTAGAVLTVFPGTPSMMHLLLWAPWKDILHDQSDIYTQGKEKATSALGIEPSVKQKICAW